MATPTQNGDDLFQQAICAWESAVDSGVKMQEESAKWLREMFCNSHSITEWYNKGQAAAGEAIVKTQENIDEAIRVINQQAETSVRLMQKAVEARQNDAAADVRKRTAEWWETAMESLRANSQAMLKVNSHMLTTWCDMARKVNSEAAERCRTWRRKRPIRPRRSASRPPTTSRKWSKQASRD